MRSLPATLARSALTGALVGLTILGVGGRVLMRMAAHWEGRLPSFTMGGTTTILFLGTVVGLAGGLVHGLVFRYIRNPIVRNAVFAATCAAIAWREANVAQSGARLLFVALALVYVIALELIAARRAVPENFPEHAQSSPVS